MTIFLTILTLTGISAFGLHDASNWLGLRRVRKAEAWVYRNRDRFASTRDEWL